MIKKDDNGQLDLICDACGDAAADGPFETFEEAAEYRKENEWGCGKNKKTEKWWHVCPSCNISSNRRKLSAY